jgi:hypothetical protein
MMAMSMGIDPSMLKKKKGSQKTGAGKPYNDDWDTDSDEEVKPKKKEKVSDDEGWATCSDEEVIEKPGKAKKETEKA